MYNERVAIGLVMLLRKRRLKNYLKAHMNRSDMDMGRVSYQVAPNQHKQSNSGSPDRERLIRLVREKDIKVGKLMDKSSPDFILCRLDVL